MAVDSLKKAVIVRTSYTVSGMRNSAMVYKWSSYTAIKVSGIFTLDSFILFMTELVENLLSPKNNWFGKNIL